jgi:hypothetical protein
LGLGQFGGSIAPTIIGYLLAASGNNWILRLVAHALFACRVETRLDACDSLRGPTRNQRVTPNFLGGVPAASFENEAALPPACRFEIVSRTNSGRV